MFAYQGIAFLYRKYLIAVLANLFLLMTVKRNIFSDTKYFIDIMEFRTIFLIYFSLFLIFFHFNFFAVVAVTAISPLEIIRTKIQSEQLSYKQVGVAISKTVEQGGFLMMMRGLGPSLLRDVPFSGDLSCDCVICYISSLEKCNI